MAKFDVYLHPGERGYLLDVQADMLAELSTRVVVPLVFSDQIPKFAKRLNPEFCVEGAKVVMAPQHIATVPKSMLKSPVANLKDEFSEITQALDMVFQGF